MNFSTIIAYFREVAGSIKFQVSAAVSFGLAIILFLNKVDPWLVVLTILFTFPVCMLIASIFEKIFIWNKSRKKRLFEALKRKAGFLKGYQYNYKLHEPWPDPKFSGMGWIVAINALIDQAFLTDPACLSCRGSLIMRIAVKHDGFYLECAKCATKYQVGDVGETRAIADSVFQGEVRNHPRKYFG